MATLDTTQTLPVLTVGLLAPLLVTRDAGSGTDPVVVNAGTLNVNALSTIEVSNGAKLVVGSITASVLDSITVDTGGTLELGSGLGVNVLSSVNFGASGGTLVLDQGADLSVLSTINGFGQGSTIDVAAFQGGSAFTAAYTTGGLLGPGGLLTPAGTAVTVYNGSGAVLGTIFLAGGDITSMLKLATDGSGGTTITFGAPTCFLSGTMIATASGMMPVEALEVGDLVMTAQGHFRPLVWVGEQTVTASTKETAPVRIRAGAFADGVPMRDLLVTPEHCIFVAGKLIPARMLVNGRSIVSDCTFASYTYHHLELETHDLLMAEGLATESYLDTGNRNSFATGNVHQLFAARAKSWETDACAPLAVDRETVEPVWQRLDERAAAMGLARAESDEQVTDDPALRLLTDDGRLLRPLRVIDGRHYFLVAPGTKSMRMISRIARPDESVGPFVDDRRALGVLVGEIGVWRDAVRTPVDAHLGEIRFSGWLDSDSATHRWTNGSAVLPISLEHVEEITLIDIQVCSGGPYLRDLPLREIATAA